MPMTVDDLRESDVPVSPVMGLLLGLPAGDPRIVSPVRGIAATGNEG